MWSLPTPREFIVSRLTLDMEHKLLFILSQVPQRLHYTYLERFRQRFLHGLGSETLIADLIRFICTVVHPSNSVLRSDVVQRWELVKTLLAYIKVRYLLTIACGIRTICQSCFIL